MCVCVSDREREKTKRVCKWGINGAHMVGAQPANVDHTHSLMAIYWPQNDRNSLTHTCTQLHRCITHYTDERIRIREVVQIHCYVITLPTGTATLQNAFVLPKIKNPFAIPYACFWLYCPEYSGLPLNLQTLQTGWTYHILEIIICNFAGL